MAYIIFNVKREFALIADMGFVRLVILTVYKKEGQMIPASVIETDKSRKKQWEEERAIDELD